MKRKSFWRMALVGVFALMATIGTLAQTSKQMNLSGLINDFTPSNVTPAGPWEVRGDWSLTLNTATSRANFSAALTMVRSDYWIVLNPASVDDPSTRTPHTHHLSLIDGVVSPLSNGFQVTGTATLTANGNPPPFGSSIPVQINITGGSNLPITNIQLTFGSPASGHFGTEPLEGVVLILK